MSEPEKSFEVALAELEQLIAEVESGSLPLEKMIDRIENGAKLIKLCQSKLNTMNSKVEMLFKDDGAAGEFADFDPDNERTRATKRPPAPLANDQEELPF